MNGSRGMMSLVRSRCACKDVFQTSKLQLLTVSAANKLLGIDVSLDIASLEFGIYEIVLAGETGTVFVLLVGLCPGRQNELDRRA